MHYLLSVSYSDHMAGGELGSVGRGSQSVSEGDHKERSQPTPWGLGSKSNGLGQRVAMASEAMQPTGERCCRVSARLFEDGGFVFVAMVRCKE